jgi:hypothetical protein
MDNPKPILPDGRESVEKAENSKRQQLDDATFEPRSLIEQAGGYKQPEAIQNAFSGIMDNLRAPEETAKDPALHPPGDANRPRPGNIAPISPPNTAGSAAGAVQEAGINPEGKQRIPSPRAGVAEPAGDADPNLTMAGQPPESGDLTSERQLKLQQLMEKKTQIQQTLSNVEKKFDNTQEDLIANLK